MKRLASYILYTLLLSAIVYACSDTPDVVQDYGYRVETLPLPKKLEKGKTVELEFSIIREGYYEGARYKFRYFQSAGEGILSYEGNIVPMNRFREIASDNFVLTYKCTGEEQQQLDFVFFEDTFGRRVEHVVTFAGGRTEKD
jgi:hypothetical protein